MRRLNYFFKIFLSSLLEALGAKVHECFSVMFSGNDSKYYNVIESWKTVFQRFQDFFPMLRKACFLYYFTCITAGLL